MTFTDQLITDVIKFCGCMLLSKIITIVTTLLTISVVNKEFADRSVVNT